MLSALHARHADGWSTAALDRVITATAFGYSFPTNLDLDPPIDGLAPPSRADLLRDAVLNDSPAAKFDAALDTYAARRRTH